MSESQAKRTTGPGAVPERPADAPLRLVTAQEDVVYPDGAQPTDDTPTIISKHHPATPDALVAASQRDNLTSILRGRHLAHFELIEPIGVGGMAAVIRARDTQLDRFVALKILPPEMAVDEENVRRFHQEARAAAKLDHENIARVFFCGEDMRLHFIAFEYVEGENLRVILERRGQLPVGEAVRYVIQIAAGLEHAASRGVVHRDIKPSNIIIMPNGRAKLVDMGLARSMEPHQDDLTQSGVTLGTYDYISPEQALEPREADSRSDLYSLGCTFYHMLTGHAPVPEGTAAKKLHHHQHVNPVDPRELNPDVPDEVAGILGRMMAKDARDRYQRPVFLVQHLMQIAQKVGAAADLPEGGMIVDAPLRAEPRKSPLLIVSVAALGLALVLFLLSLAPQGTDEGLPIQPPVVGENKEPAKVSTPGTPVKLAAGAENSEPMVVRSAEDLARLFAAKGSRLHGRVEGTIDLGDAGLTFVGGSHESLLLEPASDTADAVLHFKYQPPWENPDLLAGLLLQGAKEVTIRGIHFEIESSNTPRFALAALAIKGCRLVHLEKCTFVQVNVPQGPFLPSPSKETGLPLASVLIDNAAGAGPQPKVVLNQCYFDATLEGGQAAMTLIGPVDVESTDCAFKPHGTLFHLRGQNKDASTTLQLNNCSAFVVHGPVFRVDDQARCHLQVQDTIFSRPGHEPPREWPNLIQQTSRDASLVRYDGERNCYHKLNALWVMPGASSDSLISTFEKFNEQAQKNGGAGDVHSSLLEKPSPWKSSAPLRELTPQEAFRVSDNLEQVRTSDRKRPLGVQECAWGQPEPLRPWLAATLPGLGPHEKLVDADDTSGAPGVYPTVQAALSFATYGDVIYIKQLPFGKPVEIAPFRLDKGGVDLTFKPYKNERPLLSMASSSETDAAMFRVQDGKLQFENLDFVLDPSVNNYQAQSIVLLGNTASCTFKECSFTLKPADRTGAGKQIPVSVVALLAPEEAMKMAPRGGPIASRIVLEDSFVRGEGDFLAVRSSRPFDLSATNSLLALTGSLVQVTASSKELTADMPATLRLEHVSAFTGEPLIDIHGGRLSHSLVPLHVETASHCLFVRLGEKPFVAVESEETTEESLRAAVIDWKGLDSNAYCNWQVYLQNTPPEEAAANINMEQGPWAVFAQEPDSRFPLTPFLLVGPAANKLWQASVDQFRTPSVLSDELPPSQFGATLPGGLTERLTPMRAVELPSE